MRVIPTRLIFTSNSLFMTDAMAIEIARTRMRELGYDDNYTLRYRFVLLGEGESRIIHAGNNLVILIEPGNYQLIKSKSGEFNVTFPQSDEMQFVHSGDVTLTNLHEDGAMGFTFLQVIPLTPNPPKP